MAYRRFTTNKNKPNTGKTTAKIYWSDKKSFWLNGNKPREFDSNETVLNIKKKFVDIEGLDNEDDLKDYNGNIDYDRIIWNTATGQMKNDNKLSKYVNDNTGIIVVIVTYSVDGGMSKYEAKDDEKIIAKMNDLNVFDVGFSKHNIPFFSYKHPSSKKNRKLDRTLDIQYPLSKDKDIISFEISKDNIKMKCGHTVHPNSIYNIMLSVFIKDKYSFRIYCPEPTCQKEWSFEDCATYANLDINEYLEFQSEITKRKSPSKACPHCKRQCSRPLELKYFRVECICKKGDWCYECGNIWKGNGMTVCGNSLCYTSLINNLLKNCEIENRYANCDDIDAKVPALRACPSCYKITQHQQACKHMRCPKCKTQFCFVCLSIGTNDSDGNTKWGCKTGDDPYLNCGVASIQKIE